MQRSYSVKFNRYTKKSEMVVTYQNGFKDTTL